MITDPIADDKENISMEIDTEKSKQEFGNLNEDYDIEVVEDEEDEEEEEDDDEESDEEIREIKPPKPAQTSPPANDFEGLAKKLMKPIPDYPVKDTTHYVWEIENWSGLKEDKIRSPKFKCGDYEWNILLFPKGNNNNYVSVYMEPHPIPNEDGVIDDDWYVYAQFALDLWNPNHPDCHLPSGSSHRFSKADADWGFLSLIDSKQLALPNFGLNQKHPILENNKLNITGYVTVIDDSETGVLGHSFIDYDSKKHTGYVGLSNQGATCYLNSLLQSYFTTKAFRKLVYQIPTENDVTGKSVPLSLQRIFYNLSASKDAIGTLELTKSFGWDSSDAFTQHDVQELNRILMDKLETAMKGTKIENSLNDIFVGKMKSYIKCLNVPYESSRVEDFWDIQLNVRGFKNLQESFQNYIEIELLDGENKYQAGDNYGYQDAKKGVVFESFPPVLHLQLKRFEYDFMVDDLVKIDDFYEFPDEIDLKPYLDEDLDENVKNENWNYKLHGVLVHQGSISNGHYYAMIKPNSNDKTWLRFDDDKVWKVTPYEVFQANYGANELSNEEFSRLSRAEQQENLIRRVTSAYMLVYYRESELDNILPVDDKVIDSAIPSHIPNQLQFEIEEKERLERLKQEALYYTNVKFITANSFCSFNGFDLYPDPTMPKLYDELLINPSAKPISLKLKKDDKFSVLYKAIGKELGYAEAEDEFDLKTSPFKLVTTNHRNNHTNRADSILSNEVMDLTINAVYSSFFNRKYDEMVFYVDETKKDLHNVNTKLNSSECSPKDFKFESIKNKLDEVNSIELLSTDYDFNTSGQILIFLKYFDPISQEARGLTHVRLSKDALVDSLVKPINNFLGFNTETSLTFFEELSHSKIEKLDSSLSFEKNELNNGDILTVELSNIDEFTKDKRFKNAQDYYNFLLTKLHILIKPFKGEADEEDSDFVADENDSDAKSVPSKGLKKTLDMWISTSYNYEDLAKVIGQELDTNLDPSYLRLFIVNGQGQKYPLKSSHHLSQFFSKTVSASQITTFEYEILNIKLRDYENLKEIKVYWLNTLLNYQLFELLVPRNGNVKDLIEKLLHKVEIPRNQLKHLLVWSGLNHKYYDLVKFDRPIESINNNLELYVGIFPAEVEILVSHDMIKRYLDEPISTEEFTDPILKDEYLKAQQMKEDLNLIPAFHFYKSSNYHHGIPFILPVFPNEDFSVTKERLKHKLGLGSLAFEKIKIALADSNDKGHYIDNENKKIVLYDELNKSQVQYSLALDHPDRSPRRQNQFERGISIK